MPKPMKRIFEIVPSTSELAETFAELPSDEQALFFLYVADIFRSWSAYERDHQMLALGAALKGLPNTADHARRLVADIAAELNEDE